MQTPWKDTIPITIQRLNWARRNIDQFNGEIETFLCAGPYAVIRTHTREFGQCVQITYSFCGTAEPPDHLRFMAGDIVHNLRAALDNLVWGIAKAHGADDYLALKFTQSADSFAKEMKKRDFDRLPIPIQNWYADEQMYRRPEVQVWRNQQPAEMERHPSPLQTLNDLWNKDKHRLPALMAGASSAIWTGFATSSGGWRLATPSEVGITCYAANARVHGTPIADFTLCANRLLDFKPRFTVDIGFQDGPSSARLFLDDAENHIRTAVLPKFEPFLR